MILQICYEIFTYETTLVSTIINWYCRHSKCSSCHHWIIISINTSIVCFTACAINTPSWIFQICGDRRTRFVYTVESSVIRFCNMLALLCWFTQILRLVVFVFSSFPDPVSENLQTLLYFNRISIIPGIPIVGQLTQSVSPRF